MRASLAVANRPARSVPRRRGLLVALLGPDGAGKTTLIRRLEADPTLNARSLYMGRNPPMRRTSIPAPRWLRRARPGRASRLPPVLSHLSKLAAFGHLLVEQWLCYLAAYRHRRAGRVVLFDRYIYRTDPRFELRSRASRFRKRLLEVGAPRPDLVIILDAPSEVLHGRKPEHTLERLEEMRAAHRGLASALPNAVVVDASESADDVAGAVLSLIRSRRGRTVASARGVAA